MVPASDACHGFVQARYPDFLDSSADSAAAQLKQVIWSCLRSRPDELSSGSRPAACQVQAALHNIMQQFAWSSSLADAGVAQPRQ